ncbi:hypothetical protein O9H85_23790 [Paenibacillus filicis]|uniref:Uncharacterized protein n=1 Tax=Paenibacillus gyeongsangnamensis TaxID=3388067 RepID=A0ABT4QF06_9BACL|nr:hypothetical protein [Paenibacillus filicis]MCZ8515377.1 hypothetical protein [Paenibacillus filicis]
MKKTSKYSVRKMAVLLIALLLASCASFASSAFADTTFVGSWIGNTFGGMDNKWVQNNMLGIYVDPDGTVTANSFWDEGGREVGVYKDGDEIGLLPDMHGWGRHGGYAVTADSNYLYITMSQAGGYGSNTPPSGTTWYAVQRFNKSTLTHAPFTGGSGPFGDMLVVSQADQLRGLAYGSNKLYVSDFQANAIKIYDTDTMTLVSSIAQNRPGALVLDKSGYLWVVQIKDGITNGKVRKYDRNGDFQNIEITDVVDPTALAIDNAEVPGNLLVADNGPDQQIKMFSISGTPSSIGALGTLNGIYSGTKGQYGDLKLNGPTGVGVDANGNYYVSGNGFGNNMIDVKWARSDLRKFSPDKTLVWKLLGLEFVDAGVIDAAADTNLYTSLQRFDLDYSQSGGKEGTYGAQTFDRFAYPNDPRLNQSGFIQQTPLGVRYIQGKKFLYLTGQYADLLGIYRFDGEIAVPSGLIAGKHSSWPTTQPASGAWIWKDDNGDGDMQSSEFDSVGTNDPSSWGWDIDSQGNIWQAFETSGISEYPVQGLDAIGNPIYTRATKKDFAMPAPFNVLQRVKYVAETDTMYLAGYIPALPKKDWGRTGSVLARYDNWSAGNRTATWTINLEFEVMNQNYPKAMTIEGGRIFMVYGSEPLVYVYNTDDGTFVGTLWMTEQTGYRSGWVDVPYAINAYQRPTNGEFIVTVEEDERAKQNIYRYGNSYTSTTPVLVDDASSQIAYTGKWNAITGLNARYYNTLHRSNVSGSSAEFTFNGTAVALFGDRNPTAGTGDIYIDNVLVSTISFQSNSSEAKTDVFQISGLSKSSHTIKFVSKGTGLIYVDAIKYTP